MADDQRCYFLELPRELRNYVYDEITTMAILTKKDTSCDEDFSTIWPMTLIEGVPPTNLLLLNKQIREECQDRLYGRATLTIKLSGTSAFPHGAEDSLVDLSSLKLKPDIPATVLKSIRDCYIIFNWATAMDIVPEADLNVFFNDFMRMKGATPQRDMAWTPSKEVCSQLLAMFERIKPLFRDDLKIDLLMDLTGHPDADDPYETYLKDSDETAGYEDVKFAELCFDRDTFHALADDSRLNWPRRENVHLSFIMWTPLYCGVAENSAEVLEDRKKSAAESTAVTVLPKYQACDDLLMWWHLVPDDGPNNWRGFFPGSAFTSYKEREDELDGGL